MDKDAKREFLATLQVGKYKLVPIGGDASLTYGSLEARLGAIGDVTFFWRLDFLRKTIREKIGLWDRSAPPKQVSRTPYGFTKAAAIKQAQAFAQIHTDWLRSTAGGGYPAYLLDLEQTKLLDEQTKNSEAIEQAKQAAELAVKAAEQRRYTFANLLIAYADYLQSQGKQAAYDARNILRNHVIAKHPLLAARVARDITDEQIADVIRIINESGKDRTANKARSYIRAAFTMAIKAKTSPKLPLALKGFNIRTNPVATVSVIEGANRTDKNPFNSSEMQTYWQAIESVQGARGAILRLHLLTGAQRIAQLCRVQFADIGDDSIKLFDAKGKRNEPREHLVPLTPLAMIQVEQLRAINRNGPHLISLNHGKIACSTPTLNDLARDAVDDSIEQFTMKRLRSGVETMLSKAGVSREVRGQLQSHGLNGVQLGSYDANDFMPEKLKALNTLQSLLQTTKSKKVLPFTK